LELLRKMTEGALRACSWYSPHLCSYAFLSYPAGEREEIEGTMNYKWHTTPMLAALVLMNTIFQFSDLLLKTADSIDRLS